CVTCRFKSRTYRCLADLIPVPRTFEAAEAVDRFPVFVKPDRGQGSEEARVVYDNDGLRSELRRRPDLLVSEYLPGDEYTIDCFSDSKIGLLFCRGRERLRVKSGISMSCRGFHLQEFETWARAISDRLRLRGAWFFQMKRDAGGKPRLLEVGPRIAGAMCMH